MILRIAWRSITRNRRRTFVTIGAMAFAGALMIFYGALLDGYMLKFKLNALRLEMGELQIHAPGYRDEPDIYKTMDDADALCDAIGDAGYLAAPRWYGFALASTADNSAGVELRGIDVTREKRVTTIADYVATGTWLKPNDPDGVVIGRKLAKRLSVKPGTRVGVLGQRADGMTADQYFTVRGVLRASSERADAAGFFISRSAFRELLAAGPGAHEIVIRTASGGGDLDAAFTKISGLAKGKETVTWRDISPFLAKMMDFSLVSQLFMLGIVYLAVAMVVLNAMLMTVFERIREFGVMKAVGMKPGQIAGAIFFEGFFQATFASCLALALGVPITAYFAKNGIDVSGLGESASIGGIVMDPIWEPVLTTTSVAIPVVALFLFVLVAVLYPGIKAARINPVEAIRHR